MVGDNVLHVLHKAKMSPIRTEPCEPPGLWQVAIEGTFCHSWDLFHAVPPLFDCNITINTSPPHLSFRKNKSRLFSLFAKYSSRSSATGGTHSSAPITVYFAFSNSSAEHLKISIKATVFFGTRLCYHWTDAFKPSLKISFWFLILAWRY